MNIVWAIVIGLVASIVGGILSGLFVVRKMTHDNKRVYANQLYHDFFFSYNMTAFEVVELLYSVKRGEAIRKGKITFTADKHEFTEIISFAQNNERPKSAVDRKEQSMKDVINMFRQWLQTDTEQKVKICDNNELIRLINESAEFFMSDDYCVKTLIDKYPLQMSHFGKAYKIMSQVDALKAIVEDLPSQKENSRPLYNDVVDTIRIMLDILEGVYEVFQEIQYYHTAKPWTWHIFMPLTRN